MKRILVVANETVAGRALIDAVKRHADQGDVRVHVICPQNEPKHGYVIHDHHIREAAENRLQMTVAQLEDEGLEAIGQVMHPDPFTAIQNAVQFYAPDEIVISTFPETRSGWLRADLVGRVSATTSTPVEHVISDIEGVAS